MRVCVFKLDAVCSSPPCLLQTLCINSQYTSYFLFFPVHIIFSISPSTHHIFYFSQYTSLFLISPSPHSGGLCHISLSTHRISYFSQYSTYQYFIFLPVHIVISYFFQYTLYFIFLPINIVFPISPSTYRYFIFLPVHFVIEVLVETVSQAVFPSYIW